MAEDVEERAVGRSAPSVSEAVTARWRAVLTRAKIPQGYLGGLKFILFRRRRRIAQLCRGRRENR